jgi:hypothetical protein
MQTSVTAAVIAWGVAMAAVLWWGLGLVQPCPAASACEVGSAFGAWVSLLVLCVLVAGAFTAYLRLMTRSRG